MNKFYRDVLRVSCIRTAEKGEQPTTLQKAFGHFPASFGQSRSFVREERLHDWVARGKALLDPGCQNLGRRFAARNHSLPSPSRCEAADRPPEYPRSGFRRSLWLLTLNLRAAHA